MSSIPAGYLDNLVSVHFMEENLEGKTKTSETFREGTYKEKILGQFSTKFQVPPIPNKPSSDHRLFYRLVNTGI